MFSKLLECFGSFALAYASERDPDIASNFAVSNIADNVFSQINIILGMDY